MSQESKHKRRSFCDEFKRDAVNSLVKQGYSFRAAEACAVLLELRRNFNRCANASGHKAAVPFRVLRQCHDGPLTS